MTKDQLKQMGLSESATPEEIQARLDQLTRSGDRHLRGGMLCPPDVDIADVRRRMSAGIDPEAAIEASRSQLAEDARREQEKGGAK